MIAVGQVWRNDVSERLVRIENITRNSWNLGYVVWTALNWHGRKTISTGRQYLSCRFEFVANSEDDL